jgi:uncharacterized membrane protein
MLGTVHWVSASLALLVGGLQLARAKGTRGHRQLGWTYAGLVVTLNSTALVIYRDTGTWNQFHWLALASLATLLVALGGFAIRGPRWWVGHAYFSGGSYLGIVLAGLFQLATHVPMRTEAVRAAWLLTIMLAAWLFLWKVPREVQRTRGTAPARHLASSCD